MAADRTYEWLIVETQQIVTLAKNLHALTAYDRRFEAGVVVEQLIDRLEVASQLLSHSYYTQDAEPLKE